MAGGNEGNFNGSDFSDIVGVATDELEGGGEGTRRARSVEDSARARRPRVPATGTVGEDKTGGSRGRGD